MDPSRYRSHLSDLCASFAEHERFGICSVEIVRGRKHHALPAASAGAGHGGTRVLFLQRTGAPQLRKGPAADPPSDDSTLMSGTSRHPPAVSVVIPTFNRARTVVRAVESVLAQTVPVLEVIVVDDGSDDDTAGICSAMPAPVRYVRQRNAGPAAARNRGMRETRGEYVAFLDSDDVWHPQKLDAQLAALTACPESAWSITDCEVVDLDGVPLPGTQGFARGFPVFRSLGATPQEVFGTRLAERDVRVAGREYSLFTGEVFELLFHGNFVFPSCALVHRRVIERVGFFDESLLVAMDNEYFHRVAAHFPLTIVMAPLFRYQTGAADARTASGNTIRLIRTALLSVERAAGIRETLSPAEARALRSGRGRLLVRLAYAHLSVLERRAARDAARQAVRSGPPVLLGGAGLYLASLLPTPLLRALHTSKRALSAGRGMVGGGRRGILAQASRAGPSR
jgi:GT2 family glycosyltransferase